MCTNVRSHMIVELLRRFVASSGGRSGRGVFNVLVTGQDADQGGEEDGEKLFSDHEPIST